MRKHLLKFALLLSVCLSGFAGYSLTVYFEPNGGTINGSASRLMKDGLSANQRVDTSSFVMACPDRRFTGWYASASGGEPYAAVVVGFDQQVFFAQWEDDTYTVNYNSSSGSGSMGPQTMVGTIPSALLKNVFTKSGYHFLGWSTTAGGAKMFDDQESVSLNGYRVWNTEGSYVDLYAVWEKDPDVNHIVFNATSGSGAMTPFDLYDNQLPWMVPDCTFTPPEFHKFQCWRCYGHDYYPGQMISLLPAGNNTTISFDAQWAFNAYYIAFDGNGADGGSTAQVTFDRDVARPLPANGFTRTGYEFAGWSTNATCEVMYADRAAVENLAWIGGTNTLYAKWAPVNYRIRLNANFGCEYGEKLSPNPVNCVYDRPATLPSNVYSRKGYAFAGWSTSADGAMEYADGATVSNLAATKGAVVELYAVWTPAGYTVRFYKGADVSGTMDDITGKTYGETFALPLNTFTRAGYVFNGWAVEDGHAARFADGESVSNLASVDGGTAMLYPDWRVDRSVTPNNFNSYLDEDGVNFVDSSDGGKVLVIEASNLIGTGDAPEGGSCVMIYADFTDRGIEARVNGAGTLKFNWRVVLPSGTGEGWIMDLKDLDTGAEIWRYDAAATQSTMTSWESSETQGEIRLTKAVNRIKWLFVGSSVRSQGAFALLDKVVWTPDDDTPLADDRKITVRFKESRQLAASNDHEYTVNTAYGELPGLSDEAAEAMKHYDFLGWFTEPDGGAMVAATDLTPKSDADLFAHWQPKTYTIRFHAGNTADDTVDQAYTYGTPVSLLPNGFTYEDGRFMGWALEPSGAVVYADGASFNDASAVDAAGVINLHAVWEMPPRLYTVRFNANGGEGAMADQRFTLGVGAALAVNAFTRAGYVFRGWSLSSAGAAAYGDGATVVDLTAVRDAVVELYAVWEPIPVPPPDPVPVPPTVGDLKVGGSDTAIVGTARAPYENAAAVYDGYFSANGVVMGSVQVKIAKGKLNRKTGAFTAKVTASIVPIATSKKVSFKNGVADLAGGISSMSANGWVLAPTVGVNGLGGILTYGSAVYVIDGARNVFTAKDSEAKAVASRASSYLGAYAMIWDDGQLTISIAAKGKVKIAGSIAGTKVSASSQLLVGRDCACVPVVIGKKVKLAFNLWLVNGEAVLDNLVWSGGTGVLSLPGLIYGRVGTTVGDRIEIGALPAGYFRYEDRSSEAMKLKLTVKTGAIKGSFKVYKVDARGRKKSVTVSVEGVLLGNVGYCNATIKKVATIPVVIY